MFAGLIRRYRQQGSLSTGAMQRKGLLLLLE